MQFFLADCNASCMAFLVISPSLINSISSVSLWLLIYPFTIFLLTLRRYVRKSLDGFSLYVAIAVSCFMSASAPYAYRLFSHSSRNEGILRFESSHSAVTSMYHGRNNVLFGHCSLIYFDLFVCSYVAVTAEINPNGILSPRTVICFALWKFEPPI